MSKTPLAVLSRPFAIEPVTSIMLPDGIFDNAIYHLRIACHYTNTSGQDLTNAKIYLESVSDPGIVATARTYTFPKIPAGATVLLTWDANFQNATPGKRLVSFVAQAEGFEANRSIAQIFVSQTRYDPVKKHYTCTVEEGTLTVSDIQAIAPAATWGIRDGKDGQCHCPPDGPWIPTGATLVWQANPAYTGLHGELPFADPWWKILALIIALIAAIVAAVAAATGGGTASIGASGTFDESEPSVHCCTPDVGAGPKRDYTVAGVASAIATGALAVACADFADPFWRGQAATPPGAGEKTVAEKVVAHWKLPKPPAAGKPYEANVSWKYTRFTDAQEYHHSVSETQTNIHVAKGVEVEAPDKVHAYHPLWVRARFHRDGGSLFKGADLYAFCLFRAPGGLYFVVPLTDDGLGFDPGANDGTYAGALDLERVVPILRRYKLEELGVWRLYLFAQDVNLTKPGTPPEIAAQTIGGFVVASAITLTFDPSLPCPLEAQASVTVI